MQYADPIAIDCEFCGFKKAYPLKQVLAYEIHCHQCGERLKNDADVMHKNGLLHRIRLWPAHLIFEGFEVFGLDLDDISDSEFDGIQTLADFCSLLEAKGHTKIAERIDEIPMLRSVLDEFGSLYGEDEWLKINLHELAELACKA